MADLWRDFWERETGTGQQVAQLHDRYMMVIIIIIIIIIIMIMTKLKFLLHIEHILSSYWIIGECYENTGIPYVWRCRCSSYYSSWWIRPAVTAAFSSVKSWIGTGKTAQSVTIYEKKWHLEEELFQEIVRTRGTYSGVPRNFFLGGGFNRNLGAVVP